MYVCANTGTIKLCTIPNTISEMKKFLRGSIGQSERKKRDPLGICCKNEKKEKSLS
jgi:hypothetical protein